MAFVRAIDLACDQYAILRIDDHDRVDREPIEGLELPVVCGIGRRRAAREGHRDVPDAIVFGGAGE